MLPHMRRSIANMASCDDFSVKPLQITPYTRDSAKNLRVTAVYTARFMHAPRATAAGAIEREKILRKKGWH